VCTLVCVGAGARSSASGAGPAFFRRALDVAVERAQLGATPARESAGRSSRGLCCDGAIGSGIRVRDLPPEPIRLPTSSDLSSHMRFRGNAGLTRVATVEPRLPTTLERPMVAPDGDGYAELFLVLPPTWPAPGSDAFRHPSGAWPYRLLQDLARLPHEYATWLWEGHTVPNGDPAEPHAPNTQLAGALLTPPMIEADGFERLAVDGRGVHFFAVIPSHADEMQLKLKKGADALYEPLDKAEVTEILDPDRPSCVPRCRRLLGAERHDGLRGQRPAEEDRSPSCFRHLLARREADRDGTRAHFPYGAPSRRRSPGSPAAAGSTARRSTGFGVCRFGSPRGCVVWIHELSARPLSAAARRPASRIAVGSIQPYRNSADRFLVCGRSTSGPCGWDHRCPQPAREDGRRLDTGIKDVEIELDAARLRVAASKLAGMVVIAATAPAAGWQRVVLLTVGGVAVAVVWTAAERLLSRRRQIDSGRPAA